jgi:hypothetical protein
MQVQKKYNDPRPHNFISELFYACITRFGNGLTPGRPVGRLIFINFGHYFAPPHAQAGEVFAAP